jgi:hypothetical protein
MNEFKKDIFIGILFALGMFGFMSGEFIISSTLFAIASIASNVKMNLDRIHNRDALCS